MSANGAKPQFKVTQMMSATTASKRFGALRERARIEPQAILEHNEVDAVLLSYADYEKMFTELETLRASQSRSTGPSAFFGNPSTTNL